MKEHYFHIAVLSFFFLVPSFFLNDLPAQPRALVVLPAKFGANTHFNLDNLAENGYSITLTGVTRQVSSCSFSFPIGNQVFEVDTLLQEITSCDSWDVIAIMPMEWRNSANPYGDLIGCTPFINLLKEAKQQGKVIWATCAGVRVLASANIINGVKVSGRSEYSAEYIAAGAFYLGTNIPPVCDQNMITSTRGMYYMQENIEMISTVLEHSGKEFSDLTANPAPVDSILTGLDAAQWNHSYYVGASQGLRSVCRTPDGGFLAAGYTWGVPGHNSDLLLIKTDIEGNLKWTKTFGDSGWEFGWSVIVTCDGGFAAAGYSSSTRAGDKNMYIVKTDTAGNLLWERQLGGAGSDVARDLVELPDGSLILAGYTAPEEGGEFDILIASLDSVGDYQWMKTIGETGPEIARSIILNSSGNLILAGETGSTTNGNRDMLIVCLNPDGHKIWEKFYHKDNYDSGYEVVEIPAGGYYIIGHADVHSQDFLELAVVKTDSAGNCLYHNLYEASTRFYDYGKSIAISPNGTLAFCGVAKKKNTRQNKLFLLMSDPDGRSLMNNWFDLEGSSWCTSLVADQDNNFVIAGQYTPDNLVYNPWLLKIQNPMVAGIGANQLEEKPFLKCYPSPFSDRLFIICRGREDARGTISIHDTTGKVIYHCNIDNYGTATIWNGIIEDGQQAKPGYYLVRFSSSDFSGYQKVLYLH